MSQSAGLGVVRGAVKAVALGVGLLGSLVSLMALVGSLTPNGWARFGVALVACVVVPAVITDRVLPDDDPAKAKGLPSDVFALTWLGVTVLFVVGLGSTTRPLLVREGDRLSAAGLGLPARLAFFLGGAKPEPGAAAAPADSGAPPSSASAAPSADAPASPEGADAGASPPTKKKKEEKGDLSPSELFKKLAPSVVTVSIKAGPLEGGGTGFLIDRDGTIATNHHVVGPAQSVTIRFINGATYEDVEILADEEERDITLLRVNLKSPKEGDAPKVDPLDLGDSDGVQVGERVISIGNPLGLEHTLSDGLVSQRRTYVGRQWIQTTAPISPGNSGGPLFNMKGAVIGITTAMVGPGFAQNLNLAVPVNAVKALVHKDYPDKHKIGKGPKSSTW